MIFSIQAQLQVLILGNRNLKHSCQQNVGVGIYNLQLDRFSNVPKVLLPLESKIFVGFVGVVLIF